jgi:hypothetical protein
MLSAANFRNSGAIIVQTEAESNLFEYAEVQPIFAIRVQSYKKNP